MKRALFVLVCISLSAVSILAQSSTRPRIVTEKPKTTQPPTIKSDSPNPQDKKTPPTLSRDSRPLPPPPPLPQKPIEDDEEIVINTNLVMFPVSVLDRNGRFISGLRQQDFKIYENGVEQKIEIFNSVEQPFTVVLLLDMSNSTQFQIQEIQDAAIKFVNQLRRDDKVMVVSFDDRIHVLSQPTNNRAVLRSAILRADFGGGTSLYDAVNIVINQHLRNVDGRKAIVLFTDGVDTTSRFADYQSTVREAEEVDALIYPLRYDTFRDMNPGGYWKRRRCCGQYSRRYFKRSPTAKQKTRRRTVVETERAVRNMKQVVCISKIWREIRAAERMRRATPTISIRLLPASPKNSGGNTASVIIPTISANAANAVKSACA